VEKIVSDFLPLSLHHTLQEFSQGLNYSVFPLLDQLKVAKATLKPVIALHSGLDHKNLNWICLGHPNITPHRSLDSPNLRFSTVPLTKCQMSLNLSLRDTQLAASEGLRNLLLIQAPIQRSRCDGADGAKALRTGTDLFGDDALIRNGIALYYCNEMNAMSIRV